MWSIPLTAMIHLDRILYTHMMILLLTILKVNNLTADFWILYTQLCSFLNTFQLSTPLSPFLDFTSSGVRILLSSCCQRIQFLSCRVRSMPFQAACTVYF